MTFRPWVILTLGVVAFLINSVLMFQEDMPSVMSGPEVEKAQEPLLTLTYSRTNRRQNLETMGLDTDLADLAAVHMERLEKEQKRWDAIVAQDPAGLGLALCPNKEVPQPYAMLRFLVYQDAQKRYVIEPTRISQLEPQPWYDTNIVSIPALYAHFERTERRRADATLMAVSAALLGQEGAALDGQSPWSMGSFGTWSYPRLEASNNRLRKMVIEYFGLMHYLTEMANKPGGICS